MRTVSLPQICVRSRKFRPVRATWFLKKQIETLSRARSATEAFLYRRLETLPDIKARFRLNVALPIAFDGFGTLEVDLR